MRFRKASKKDIENIMDIIRQGQEYLKKQGVPQWQNNYPNRETIESDIYNGYAYLVEDNLKLVGTVAVSFDGELTYDEIYQGQWLSHDDYCVVHRMAIHKESRGMGVAPFLMSCIESLCKEKNINSIKVDTHRNNIPMQQFLKKIDFQYCGIIYLADGDERLAYEKILK